MRARFTFATLMLVCSPVLAADYVLDSRLVVHEWGTFTNFSGSDGVHLEFRPLVGSDLPAFVLDRARQAAWDQQSLKLNAAFAAKGDNRSLQRMETPVMYFYTDRERIVDVRVAFPKGLLTEFYPPVRGFGPELKPGAPEPLENSFLRWGRVRLIPLVAAAQTMKGELPKVEGDNHYGYARETDSAIIGVCDKLRGTSSYEKFLFYRGVGNFSLPVKLQALGDGHFAAENTGPDALRAAFLVQVKAGRVRFVEQDGLARHAEFSLESGQTGAEALSSALVRALIAQGLYDKEARAMVKTWQSSWLGEDGTRLLYLVPPALVDEILPLTIEPKPDQMVRVLVGRMELLTPEREKQIGALVTKLAAPQFADRESATAALAGMGRFAEPALERVIQVTQDEEVRARAQQLLDRMRTNAK